MSSSLDLAPKSLDVTARSIDLLTTLVETTNSGSGVIHLAVEIGRWLGREKLSESQLQGCLQKARGLVQANQRSHEFYETVASGSRRRAVGLLFSQPSGSLGRLMAQDPYLSWMTSTIACLFEFHGEAFISDVLCALIMQAEQLRNGGRALTEYDLIYHPLRPQLKPVLDKIVSSVWFNVVNSGVAQPGGALRKLTALPLPPEIEAVCPHGHHLGRHRLGLALSQLRNVKDHVIIESNHLISNLVAWLVHHFRGHLRLIVSGKIVYNQVLGPENVEIEHRVRKFCPIEDWCEASQEGFMPVVKIFTAKAGRFQSLFQGHYDTQKTLDHTPRVRQKLYQAAKYPSGIFGGERIRVLVRHAASEMVNWLLDLKVVRLSLSDQLCFQVLTHRASREPLTEELRICDLLGRVPSILNMGWRQSMTAKVVFASSSPRIMDDDDDEKSEEVFPASQMDLGGSSKDLNDYRIRLADFPVLYDLLEGVRPICLCSKCRTSQPPKSTAALKPGCFQHTAFMETMTLIAHSIADGFGADDCSHSSVRQNDFGVTRILRDVTLQFVEWGAWLDTAARVVLGCPRIDELLDTRSDEDFNLKGVFDYSQAMGQTPIAVQHGSLAVVAPWVDITLPISVQACFSFRIVEGRLGVLNPGESQFQGLQGDSAIIVTQHSEDVQSFSDRFPIKSEALDAKVSLQIDPSYARTDCVLVGYGTHSYVLLARVLSASHSRFIDLSRTIFMASQVLPSISCRHKPTEEFKILASDPVLKLYSFDDLLGRWPDKQKHCVRDTEGNGPQIGKDSGSQNDLGIGEADADVGNGMWQVPTYHDSEVPKRGEQDLKPDGPQTFRVCHFLDTHLKYNTALALLHDSPTMLNYERACLSCLMEQARTIDIEHGADTMTRDRWVICRSRNPSSEPLTSVPSESAASRKRVRGVA